MDLMKIDIVCVGKIKERILDKMIPVTVASVNFKKSFIILIVFASACY